MKFLITLICLISSFINLKAQIDSTTNIYIHDVGLTFDYQFKQKEGISLGLNHLYRSEEEEDSCQTRNKK